ncbi:ribonuclease H-like domain-containing protein [Radiomyces spectabilis]|uniref:ribonuclease H-like domain-containing protein n=1 Tax=Radiomyces spectabilis TaxID=64574 RepID=UPI00221E63DC|nr:ribonuclease H-like domain-containing protein [Radiomyces spectabilis]KAI8384926.1 ribonuclease H-like domain-containing protein [Radiomyces spectabilis]
MRAHAPLKIRQVTATKVFEHFKRIYAPLNNPTLATEHAKRQETQILESTTNVAGYKQQATTVLLALKRRPEAIDPSDIGIVGDWVDPATKPKIDIVEEANNFCLSVDMMTQLGYPLASLLAPSEPIPTIVGTERECCRCKRNYIVKDVLDETDVTLCEYHYGRSRVVRQYGEKHKIYTCCNGSFEDKGCTHGPHVFKETDLQSLHNLIPFIATPAKDPSSTTRRKLVALDCEMAYTTAGMELIRLTALDERLEVLLDELVLPSQMLIDLNTQFSGVKTLEGVKHDLTSVRQELFKYVDADTILIGHGLENDLIAMRVLHEKSIDTAALFPHPEGLPYRYSLRLLCSKYLSKFIQDGSDGHDSYEDAKTCMELLEFHIRKQKK